MTLLAVDVSHPKKIYGNCYFTNPDQNQQKETLEKGAKYV